uniref:Putative homeobox transcription factor sip1 n=1 Tax=Ixodes ricinus TaxID=34613 RepID=A0A6B0UZ40_IXORI
MAPQLGILSKGFGTVLALKWLFTSVCSIVVFQIVILSKGLWALLALIWLFTSVRLIMALQMGISSKGLGTLLALKWLFTSVCSIMPCQSGILSKLFGAVLALKWLFTVVLLSVAKHLGLKARLGRMLALVLFITMGSQVANNSTLISGDMGAGTASKPDVLGDFQWVAGLPQQCGSITST